VRRLFLYTSYTTQEGVHAGCIKGWLPCLSALKNNSPAIPRTPLLSPIDTGELNSIPVGFCAIIGSRKRSGLNIQVWPVF
jgi:hypothetical protein